MNDFLLPLYQGDAFEPGSTDVGDVSWQCPTAQIHVATWPNGCPGHSWQNVSCGRTDIGHKAALHAGKVLAAAAMDLLTQPALLEEAKSRIPAPDRGRLHLPHPRRCCSRSGRLRRFTSEKGRLGRPFSFSWADPDRKQESGRFAPIIF